MRKDRFELGEEYRLSQLRPTVIVVRQVSHSAQNVSSGTPCCLRGVSVPHSSIEYQQGLYRKYGQVRPHAVRRCPGCASKYWIHFDLEISPTQIKTVEWEVMP